MLMTFLGIFSIIVAAVLLVLAAVAIIKKKKEEKPGRPEEKPEKLITAGTGEEKTPKSKMMGTAEMIIRISLAGAIFLVLLYEMYPEVIIKHHKPIIILVVAMIAGSALLGIKQDWEKSSTRKILRAHYVIFSVILILVVFYSDPEARSWLEDFQPKPALRPQALEAKMIVWTLDQTIEAPPDRWTEVPLKRDGKLRKFVPELNGRIEFLVDGRHGQTDAFGQADFGEIRKSLKVRGIERKAKVFLYTGA